MADENTNTTTEEQTTTEESTVDSNVSPELTGMDANQLLTGLLADPEVQSILTARRDGTKVSVVPDVVDDDTDSTVDDTTTQEQKDLEELDPDIKRVLDHINKRIDQQVGPLTEELKALRSIASEYERQGIDEQIKKVSTKHKDFQKFQPQISKLVENVSGLDVEELYILAKHREGELNLAEESTHSERPTATPRASMTRERKEKVPQGAKGFKQLLGEAFVRLDKQQQE